MGQEEEKWGQSVGHSMGQGFASHVTEVVTATERHFAPEELAGLWHLSVDTVRRLFEHEAGVLIIERTKTHGRRYRTLRVPESVALRVHRRLTNVAMPNR